MLFQQVFAELQEADLIQKAIEQNAPQWIRCGVSRDGENLQIVCLQPFITELSYPQVEGVTVSVENHVHFPEYKQVVIRVGTLKSYIEPAVYPADVFTQDIHYDVHNTMVIAWARDVDPEVTINNEGRNSHIAQMSFFSEYRKTMEQLYRMGIRYVIGYPTDERRRRVYKKMGMVDADSQNPLGDLIADTKLLARL